MQNGRVAGENVHDPSEWAYKEPEYYEFAVDRASPRPGSFLLLLKSDLRSRQVIGYWATGLILVALGSVTVCFSAQSDSWAIVAVGLFAIFMGYRLIFAMLRLFLAVLRQMRLGPVLRGRIPSLGRSSFVRGTSTVNARLPDGRTLLVSLKIAPALAALGEEVAAEVLILATLDEKSGFVIALRAIPKTELTPPPLSPPDIREDPHGHP